MKTAIQPESTPLDPQVSAYIASFTDEKRTVLTLLREAIRQAAPQAVEKMSYRMPSYHLNGPLVYFAMARNHIGLYPTPSAVAHFREELSSYKTSKGAIQFPLGQQLPLELICRIVAFKLEENQTQPRNPSSGTPQV